MLGVVPVFLSICVLYRELTACHAKYILRQIGLIPIDQVAVALVVATTGFGIMAIYDLLVMHYLKQSLALGKIARADSDGAAFSNNNGLFLLAGALSPDFSLFAAAFP